MLAFLPRQLCGQYNFRNNWRILNIVVFPGCPRAENGGNFQSLQLIPLSPFSISARTMMIGGRRANSDLSRFPFCKNPKGVEEETIFIAPSAELRSRLLPQVGRFISPPLPFARSDFPRFLEFFVIFISHVVQTH